MRLSAAIQGNLKAMMAAEVKAAEKAVSGVRSKPRMV
jgi:hypothetical protein